MGRLILCCGKKAEQPWYVKETDTRLYSIEELCYYIYNNIYIISTGFFTLSLTEWIKDELGLLALADKLKGLILHKNSCKDMVVTVLCGCDYYVEEEMKQLVCIMDKLSNMSEAQREKYKADLWLKKGYYSLAASEYRKLLGRQADGLNAEDTGNVFHNMGVACLYTGTLEEAARHFLEAYGRNKNKESLRAYAQVCSMLGKEIKELSKEEAGELLSDFWQSEVACRETVDYKRLLAAIEKKSAGQASEYYEEIDRLLREWKREYRKKVG